MIDQKAIKKLIANFLATKATKKLSLQRRLFSSLRTRIINDCPHQLFAVFLHFQIPENFLNRINNCIQITELQLISTYINYPLKKKKKKYLFTIFPRPSRDETISTLPLWKWTGNKTSLISSENRASLFDRTKLNWMLLISPISGHRLGQRN